MVNVKNHFDANLAGWTRKAIKAKVLVVFKQEISDGFIFIFAFLVYMCSRGVGVVQGGIGVL